MSAALKRWVCAMPAVLLAGCMTVKYGRPPLAERIETELKPQVSTKADVLRVLGAPRGYGQASLASLPKDRVIWFYEFTKANGWTGAIRFKILLVFFDGEKFDGDLWFSSIEGAPPVIEKQ